MAFNFPDSPSNGDQYIVAGNTYTWNGASWDATGSAGSSGSANIENDIDNHLNTSSASSSEVLSWNGSDYDWVSGGGSSTFIGLTDTPSSFTADKWLKVNSAANALEFVDAPSGGGGGGGSSDPVGTIVAWAGSVANIPSDYQLCDGSAA